MPKITFIEAGQEHGRVVDADVGISVMEAARNVGIAGIAADCGGACICGTCHVHVDAMWRDRVGPPTDIEIATMDFSEDVRSESRLSCQIKVTEDLDGLVLRVPGA
ncbi:ferredoxin, 2Fe-2S [Novosphingobium sp. CF614]|uniref:2Fe-2S iron-sulfur cluster-binding protein n=1 Tax=Novosphingobium sp. CF614 TaxID=1884364 RepID=UPI0008E07395|nr:2Fe-2S iron-sulfur cluster-binding protein [Novosphingobium sp. CF614]SFF77134.1 ferredoxin, 2Fe-2S [Novosphingobium sp. CF614]